MLKVKSFATCFIVLTGFSLSMAQQLNDSSGFKYDLDKKWRAGVSLNIGAGFENHDVGRTSDDQDVTISGGGGFGGNIVIAYGMSQEFELRLDAGIQNSELIPNVENAEGSFMRSFIIAGLDYRLPVARESIISIGAGIGYYAPDDLDIDMRNVQAGGHNIFSYDGSFGFQVRSEYIGFINETYSWAAGVKYYYASYKLNKASLDGIQVPVSSLPDELTSEVGELDGSGIDLTLSLNIHF